MSLKIKNKEQLLDIAKGIFKSNKKVQKVAVTTDGMPFIIDQSEGAVKNHANNNRYKKELTIHRFIRDEVMSKGIDYQATSKASTDGPTAKELIVQLKDCDLLTATAILNAEKERESTRSTVIKAAEERVSELTNNDE